MNFEERKRRARSKYKVGDRVRIKDDYIGAVEINGLIGWIKVVQPKSENLQFYRVAFASGLNVVTSEENLEADKPDDTPDDSTETIGAEPIASPDFINRPSKVDKHIAICAELTEIYTRKNTDYGNSFAKQLEEYGLVSVAIRLEDKLSRFKHLIGNEAKVDESIQDTLMDMANYAILTLIEMEEAQ